LIAQIVRRRPAIDNRRMRYAVAVLIVLAAQRSIQDGVYAASQATRGGAVYADRCASCHADDLSGRDQAPALAGHEFNAEWEGLSLNDLFERIRVSMPADKPGSLTRQEVADVTAFLLATGDFPRGETELAADPDTLKAIKFLAGKPR
jgi:mono/diheme cytochrome c family protein